MQELDIKREKEWLEQERLYQETLQARKADRQREIDEYQKKYFDLVQTIRVSSTDSTPKTKNPRKQTTTKQAQDTH